MSLLLVPGCAKQGSARHSELRDDAQAISSEVPFPVAGCGAEIRKLSDDVKYPELYQRVIDGSKALADLGPLLPSAFLDDSLVQGLLGLQNELKTAQ